MEYNLVEDVQLQARLKALMALIRPKRAVGTEKKRYGRDWDGGYVMLDTLETAKISYSLGISDDVSWDLGMAGFGSDVYMYDHTVSGPPIANDHFFFSPIGIASNDVMAPNLRRLDTLVRQNGHANTEGLVLKMDIEGHEWDTYDVIEPAVLGLFDQIVCEFHSTNHFLNDQWLARAERALTKLHASHQVVHVHGNNNGSMNVIAGLAIPDVFELTLANRRRYEFTETFETFPIALDMPCTPARPELILGSFVF